MEDIMTDKQMFTMLKMILKILKRCNTLEEAIKEIEELINASK